MTVGIVGLGLIGGSFAKAYHAAGWTVYGYDVDESMLAFAQLADAVNAPLTMENIGTCDLVLLCVRPLAAIDYLRSAAPHIGSRPVVIDCCGTKRVVCAAAFPLAEQYRFTYLGGHPMAGREFSGLDYALPTLFDGASMIFVPTKSSTERVLEQLEAYFMSLGFGQTVRCTAEQHDHMIAFTSQLAHVVSSAYIKSPEADKHNGYSAGSYKDLTRVAKLNETMWSELFLCNAEPLAAEIDEIIKHLDEYRRAIRAGDRETLTELLREGRIRKENLG